MSTLRIGMEIQEFVGHYKNHPVLFIGTGFSLRYLQNSFSWNGLLEFISFELTENEEFYYDLKAESMVNGEYSYDLLASKLELEFNKRLAEDRKGKFVKINDIFYDSMKEGIKLSRFKIYLTQLLTPLMIKPEKSNEIDALIRARKNIGSVITTNYDRLCEKFFEFNPLIGNDILLSNPYGSVYKIHGCVSDSNNIIITREDYDNFNNKYELIRAQLLSIFIHNPIIFIGYSISDSNIKSLLKTIFSYVNVNTALAKKIRDNFLLVEYAPDNQSIEITEHDIDIEGMATIRINKIKTDNYTAIYDALSKLVLPVSAMDIRKVQKVWNTIKSGGEIKVNITENIDELKNEDMVLAVGSEKTVKYEFQTKTEMIQNYFKIVDEANSQLISLLNKQVISTRERFPIFAFSSICENLINVDKYKSRQIDKIIDDLKRYVRDCENNYTSITDITNNLADWKVIGGIMYAVMEDNISLSELKKYLEDNAGRCDTDFRKLLCLYDYLAY
ncbi:MULTISPECIES: SIR2 family protein [Klebsiella]|nr:SIR2 family protein [Klebsiella pneumoniae]MCD5877508.1 SIR2 family protein [Klebsiella pneumoniae]MCD5900211.1 SIR2 family protein [Klebsiella pneumoniae]MCD5959351.1 SIR2 family protein [Klebsiella pneumoniae]MCD9859196.1 SIR2 family protein [Klebsiella pneumoniae]MCJ4424293.1 SIR2 family protein [Klebsiella pneumoniae]